MGEIIFIHQGRVEMKQRDIQPPHADTTATEEELRLRHHIYELELLKRLTIEYGNRILVNGERLYRKSGTATRRTPVSLKWVSRQLEKIETEERIVSLDKHRRTQTWMKEQGYSFKRKPQR